MTANVPVGIILLSIVAIVMLRSYWPSEMITNGLRDITRGIFRALLMISILVGVTSIGFHVLHFDISPEWTQTIMAFTIAGFFAGSLGNAIFDRVWRK